MAVVAITGSNGFIGSSLVVAFQELGHVVHRVRRDLLQYPRRLEIYFEEIQPDFIIHCAGYGNMSHQYNEQEIINTNIMKTWNLIQASRSIKFKALINLGSSSEYGSKTASMREVDLPETDTFYGSSKVASTYLCRAAARQYKKSIITVRPFSVYGPGEADFRFIPTIARSKILGTTLTLVPDAMHDWIYIDDFIDGIFKVLVNAKELAGQVVNIGSGKQYSNKEVVDLIWKPHTPKNIQLVDSLRKYDTSSWVADTSVLSSLSWKPKFSLEAGLIRTYAYYEQKLKT